MLQRPSRTFRPIALRSRGEPLDNAWVRFVFRSISSRDSPTIGRCSLFGTQGLPFHRHPVSASAGVALLRQGLARFTFQRRTLLGGVSGLDAPGHSPERVERRKRRHARELRSPRLPGLLLHLRFRYLAAPLPPVDVRPDRKRRCPLGQLHGAWKHRRRPQRGRASEFPTACSMPTPTTWRSRCCLESAPSCFCSTRRHAPDGWPALLESCSPPSMRPAPDRGAASLPRSAMLILIFSLSRSKWKVAALGLTALGDCAGAASCILAANPPARCIACPFSPATFARRNRESGPCAQRRLPSAAGRAASKPACDTR